MAIGRMSIVHNADRYFSMGVDEYNGRSIKGVLFHGSMPNGIHYDSLLELFISMDRIFDEMGCPKQTLKMRSFPGTKAPAYKSRECEEPRREGKLATFRICVKYRYHASWQGTISWKEGKRAEEFESELQLIMLIDQFLNGHLYLRQNGKFLNTLHVAIDAYQSGRIIGNYQNIPAQKVERFYVPADLAETLGNFMEIRNSDEAALKKRFDYGQLITSEACSRCRKGGRKASFSIKIMFREHFTWQGVIYWKEGRGQQQFRSFKEMLFMIASALEMTAAETRDKYYKEDMHLLAIGS